MKQLPKYLYSLTLFLVPLLVLSALALVPNSVFAAKKPISTVMNSRSKTTSFQYVDLGTLGGEDSDPWAMNDLGQVVGGSESQPGNYTWLGFLWTARSGMEQFGVSWCDMRISIAHGISSNGKVVGRQDCVMDSGYIGGYLYDSVTKQMFFTATYPGADVTYPYSANSSGHMVGMASPVMDAMYWSNPSTIVNLNTYLNADFSYGRKISDSGIIIGDYSVANTVRGYVMDEANMSAFTTLNPLPGDTDSFTYDRNDSGIVVGGSMSSSANMRAVMWQNGVPSYLGTLGGETSYAAVINNSNLIAGFADNALGENKPFFYQNGTMHDLTQMINGGLPAGLEIVGILDMDNSGNILARTSDGYTFSACILYKK